MEAPNVLHAGLGGSLQTELLHLQDVEDVLAMAEELASQHRAWQLQKQALLAGWQAKRAQTYEAGKALEAWLAPIEPLVAQRCAAAAKAIAESAKSAEAQQAVEEKSRRWQQAALEEAQRHRFSLARQRLEREKRQFQLAQEEYHRQSEAKIRQERCRLERLRELSEARRAKRDNERSRLLATLEEERDRRLPHRKLAWAQTEETGLAPTRPEPIDEEERGYSDDSFESAGSYEKDFEEESEVSSQSASSRSPASPEALGETSSSLASSAISESSIVSARRPRSAAPGSRCVQLPVTESATSRSEPSVAESIPESWAGSVDVPQAFSDGGASSPQYSRSRPEDPSESSRRPASASVRTASASRSQSPGPPVVDDEVASVQSQLQSEISVHSWSPPPSDRIASVASAPSVRSRRSPSAASVASVASARPSVTDSRSPEAVSLPSESPPGASRRASEQSLSEVASLVSRHGTTSISHISSHLPEASEIGDSIQERSYSEIFPSFVETPRSRVSAPAVQESEDDVGYSEDSFESAGESYDEKDFESESSSEAASPSSEPSAAPAKVVRRQPLSPRSLTSSVASASSPRLKVETAEDSHPSTPTSKVVTRRPFSPRSSPASPRTPRLQAEATEASQPSTPSKKVLTRRPFSPRSSASPSSPASPRTPVSEAARAALPEGSSRSLSASGSVGSGSRQPPESVQSFSG